MREPCHYSFMDAPRASDSGIHQAARPLQIWQTAAAILLSAIATCPVMFGKAAHAAESAAQLEDASDDPRQGPRIDHPAAVDPIYVPDSPNAQAPNLVSTAEYRDALAFRLALDFPLGQVQSGNSGLGAQGSRSTSPTLQFTARYNPITHWFAETTLYSYLQTNRKQTWNPDFSYTFGYDAHSPETFSATYSNYGGNRFHPDAARQEKYTAFQQGTWSFGYKFLLPSSLEPVFLTGDKDRAICSAHVSWTPRYSDFQTGVLSANKRFGTLGCRYTHASGWYAHATAFGYFRRAQQQPWDPDFTYGIGYSNPEPGGISIQYNNYSSNRFPGRRSGSGDGGFRSGSFTVNLNHPW